MYTTENNQLNSSICIEAQRQINRHYSAVVQKITALCNVAALPDEVAQAIIADFNDVLQDSYRGLRLTTEGLQLLAAKTTPQQWRRLQSPALQELIGEYNGIGALLLTEDKTAIHELLSNPEKLTEALQAPINGITAVTIYEAAKAEGADNLQLFNVAVIYRHLFSILQYYEAFGIPTEQLQNIEPAFIGTSTPEDKERLLQALRKGSDKALQVAAESVTNNTGRKRLPIAGIIDADGDTIPEEAAAPQEAEEPTDAEVVEEYTDRKTEEEQLRTIAQYQNITEMLSSPLQVNSKYKDATAQLLPLRQAIEQQQAVALRAKARLTELLSNPTATPQALQDAKKDSDNADNLIASQTYIMQAFTGIVALANKCTPIGANTDYYDYGEMPANDFIRLCIGNTYDADGNLQSIGSKQKIGILRAANYISTIRTQISETLLKPKKEKDDSGKWITKYSEIKEQYTFTPAVVNFHSVTGAEVPPTDAVTVSLQIYRNIVTGRRREVAEYIDGNGHKKCLKIKEPSKHVLTETQLYAFTTDEEKRLLNILKYVETHKDENELLEAVFDYNSRITVVRSAYNDAVEEQRRHTMQLAAAMFTNTDIEHDATYIQLNAKIKEAEAQLRRTETSLRKNKGRDVAKLIELLHKAETLGVINTYWRTPSLSDKHSKQRPVWHWTRPTAEEIKQHRTRRKK